MASAAGAGEKDQRGEEGGAVVFGDRGDSSGRGDRVLAVQKTAAFKGQ